jgi:putative FmdB family regulatory protein
VPTYQYTCTECGHHLEAVQSFSDAPLTVCPNCEGRLRKVFNSVGVVFKGSGFYRTDSRNESRSSTAAKSDSTGAKSESSSTTGTKSDSSSSSSSGSSSSSSASTSKPAAPTAA